MNDVADDPDEHLPPALVEQLARRGGVRSFPAQAILVNEGDTTRSVYIVLSGRLKVYSGDESGREIVLTELGPGQYFGELSLDGEPRSASVKTLEPARCCIVQPDDWEAFLAEHPPFAAHVARRLVRQVRRLTAQVRALALQDVYRRVATLLEQSSETEGAHRVLRHRLTQQDIADRVGASREMVNRVMKELTTGGYVALDGQRQMRLLKPLPARW
ncbi:MAG: Crp/Fnr family transcriptional regulator [Rubrivivax sp.]|jgi:CRP/FNR family cyclic AMP-dependent transcriptional regulator|nr:Crp/Fnr family transcriptional regulator [Rubrivivax sp.]